MITTTTSAALVPAGPAFSDGSGGRWPGSWPAWPARPTRRTCASSQSAGPPPARSPGSLGEQQRPGLGHDPAAIIRHRDLRAASCVLCLENA